MQDSLVITVDPGDNTAVVLWENGEVLDTFFKSQSPTIKKKSAPVRQEEMVEWFHCVLQRIWETHLNSQIKMIIEGVSLWGNSTKSQASALRGDAFRLSYLVGGYISEFSARLGSENVEIVDVRTWKGNLPTSILCEHITRESGIVPKNEHIACAIGIGLWKLGRL